MKIEPEDLASALYDVLHTEEPRSATVAVRVSADERAVVKQLERGFLPEVTLNQSEVMRTMAAAGVNAVVRELAQAPRDAEGRPVSGSHTTFKPLDQDTWTLFDAFPIGSAEALHARVAALKAGTASLPPAWGSQRLLVNTLEAGDYVGVLVRPVAHPVTKVAEAPMSVGAARRNRWKGRLDLREALASGDWVSLRTYPLAKSANASVFASRINTGKEPQLEALAGQPLQAVYGSSDAVTTVWARLRPAGAEARPGPQRSLVHADPVTGRPLTGAATGTETRTGPTQIFGEPASIAPRAPGKQRVQPRKGGLPSPATTVVRVVTGRPKPTRRIAGGARITPR